MYIYIYIIYVYIYNIVHMEISRRSTGHHLFWSRLAWGSAGSGPSRRAAEVGMSAAAFAELLLGMFFVRRRSSPFCAMACGHQGSHGPFGVPRRFLACCGWFHGTFFVANPMDELGYPLDHGKLHRAMDQDLDTRVWTSIHQATRFWCVLTHPQSWTCCVVFPPHSTCSLIIFDRSFMIFGHFKGNLGYTVRYSFRASSCTLHQFSFSACQLQVQLLVRLLGGDPFSSKIIIKPTVHLRFEQVAKGEPPCANRWFVGVYRPVHPTNHNKSTSFVGESIPFHEMDEYE